MSSQRRRVRNQSATATIVNFFLDQPLDVVSGALELAQTLVARRRANGELDAMRRPRTLNPSYIPPEKMKAILAPYTQAAPTGIPPGHVLPVGATSPIKLPDAPVNAPTIKPMAQPRQRAKRSDAGQPRKRGAAAVAAAPIDRATPPARRRTRKPVDVPLPGTTAAAPELPPQDVPLEYDADALTDLGVE